MTKAELYTFTTQLLDGLQIDTTLFSILLNISQMRRENQRNWMILRKEDSSVSIGANNTFTTQNSLPSDFRKWYSRFPIVLTDSTGNAQQYLREIPSGMKYSYKSTNTRFYTNYATNKFYVCGAPSQSVTANLFYIYKPTLVSADDENEWIFPSEYHPMLGLDVATYYKLGVDYDLVNNAQANNNAALANTIFEQMAEWDNELQNSSIQGQDYGTDSNWTATATGGTLPPDIS